LSELCEQTGGRHLPAETSELPDIAANIGVELRNGYALGFVPPLLTAHFRRGYFSPTE
jgi:hypothetical protein